jgi:ABC-2 type transport system permease protein
LPVRYRDAVSTMVREIAFAIAGHELPVSEPDEEHVILGADVGPIPMRDRMRPLLAFMVLVMEAIALGSLISAEIQHKTIGAILVTPARLSDVLFSKGLIGTLVAFSEAAIVLFLIRGFGPTPGLVAFALLLGAILVTGIAMIAGAAGKDLFGTMILGIIMLIPLAIPAFSVIFPGSVAGWVRAIPSYGLVATIYGASIHGAGWAESLPDLAILAGWCVVSAAVGMLILRRRVSVL